MGHIQEVAQARTAQILTVQTPKRAPATTPTPERKAELAIEVITDQAETAPQDSILDQKRTVSPFSPRCTLFTILRWFDQVASEEGRVPPVYVT